MSASESPVAEIHDILVRPLLTEKGELLRARHNTYVFRVGSQANKIEIKQAVERLFGVNVRAVRTLNVLGKTKRRGRHAGTLANWKKAYVTLADGHELSLFG